MLLSMALVILQVYMNVWEAAPQSRPALQKLFSFWRGFIPEQTLSNIMQRLSTQQVRSCYFVTVNY